MERASVKTIQKSRLGRGWALVGGIALLGFGMAASPATAQVGNVGASTGATVGGSATAPSIECAWALNDFDHNWKSTPKMQYGQDDDPIVGAGSPCVQSTSRPSRAMMTANPYTPKVIDVKPNAHDEPSEAYVELWAAIDTNVTTPVVYFDVFHPDGSQKAQVDATKYAARTANPERCAGPTGMFAAAQSTGQLTAVAAANIQQECSTQIKQLWYGAFGISKHQPYGLYRIKLVAGTPGGASSIQEYYINVLPFSNLEKDFTSVDFGNVNSNTHIETGTGNYIFEATTAGNDQYSVRNTGNAGIGLGVKFASMCLSTQLDNSVSCTDDKRIDHFDAQFGVGTVGNLTPAPVMQSMGNDSLVSSMISDLSSEAKPAPLGATYNFDNDINRTLCPNDVGKMEFSIWTENIFAGSYVAPNGIQLVARPNPF